MVPLSADFNAAIKKVFKQEGGFTGNSKDKGNYYKGKLVGTNLGITPLAYYSYYKEDPTEQMMRTLTQDKAAPIYKANYWNKIRGDEIKNDSVADLLMFIVVNSGPGMVKPIKAVMNMTAGKKIVAETTTPFTSEEVKLLNELPQDIFFKNVIEVRRRFYNRLVEKDPTQSVFLKGWLRRLDEQKYVGAVSTPNQSITAPKVIYIAGGFVILAAATAVYLHNKKKRRYKTAA